MQGNILCMLYYLPDPVVHFLVQKNSMVVVVGLVVCQFASPQRQLGK